MEGFSSASPWYHVCRETGPMQEIRTLISARGSPSPRSARPPGRRLSRSKRAPLGELAVGVFAPDSVPKTPGEQLAWLCRETGPMQQIRKLIFVDWQPKLLQYKAAQATALEKQHNVSGSSRTKTLRLEAIGQELAGVDEEVGAIQTLLVESIVKALRGNPVRTRMALVDPLFDCNASLDSADMRAKALEVCACVSFRF